MFDSLSKPKGADKRVRVGYILPLSMVEEIQRLAILRGRNVRPCHIVEDILRREIYSEKDKI